MSEKYIPYEKMSKKQKCEIDRKKRGDWGNLNPVTRKVENKKAYKRKKFRINESGESSMRNFCFAI